MSDQLTDEGHRANAAGRSLAIAVFLGMMLGATVGSIVFAMTRQVLWIALAPGLGLVLGLIVHFIRAAGQSDD